MLHEIPQSRRFHAVPTKRDTVNTTEPKRNRLLRDHHGTHEGWPEEGAGETVAGGGVGENERTSATGEGDRGRGATFHPGSPGVTGASRHQTSSAVTPSGDGRSLTRCILVISVSCAALGNTVGTAEKERGNNTRGGKKKKKRGGRKQDGRKERRRKETLAVGERSI